MTTKEFGLREKGDFMNVPPTNYFKAEKNLGSSVEIKSIEKMKEA